MGKLIDVDTIPFFLLERGAMVAYKADIEQLSSAQPEIIRCKDCKWYKINYSWNGKEHHVCVKEVYEPVRVENDFCSRAERRCNEAN